MFMPRFPRYPSVPFDPDEGFIFVPSRRPAAPLGGLLDPIAPPEPPVPGGLLDPVGWRDFREEGRRRPARRIKQKDLPELLRDVPLGPEGGLIGYMLAEYVEPDGDSHRPAVAASESNALARSASSSIEGPSGPEPERSGSPQPAARPIGLGVPSADSVREKDLRHLAISGPFNAGYRLRTDHSGRPPNADWSRSLDVSAKIEPRPDGSVWEIRGPVRTMIRPPDSQLAHYQTQPHYPPSTEKPPEDELRAIRKKFQSLVAQGRERDYHFAADNLEHFLEGSGAPRFYDPNWLRSIPKIHAAESRVRRHFEDWVTGNEIPTEEKEFVKEDLLALKDGQSFRRRSRWDGKFNTSYLELRNAPDLFLAVGESVVKGYGDFTFHRDGDQIRFEGNVVYRWNEPYDWDKDGFTPLPTPEKPTQVIYHEDAIKLQDHGGAKPFVMRSEWRQSVDGVLREWGDRLILESAHWSDID